MRLLALCLLLIGCQGFETTGFDCSIPSSTRTIELPPGLQNEKGCWRVLSDEDHGYLLYDPGEVSCDDGDRCIVIPADGTFWRVGHGPSDPIITDVPCSTTCF